MKRMQIRLTFIAVLLAFSLTGFDAMATTGSCDPVDSNLLSANCTAGNAEDCESLGLTISSDCRGTAGDDAKSDRLFKRACDLGDSGACLFLGSNYIYGKGVKLDISKARKYLGMACHQDSQGNSTNACSLLNSLPAPVEAQKSPPSDATVSPAQSTVAPAGADSNQTAGNSDAPLSTATNLDIEELSKSLTAPAPPTERMQSDGDKAANDNVKSPSQIASVGGYFVSWWLYAGAVLLAAIALLFLVGKQAQILTPRKRIAPADAPASEDAKRGYAPGLFGIRGIVPRYRAKSWPKVIGAILFAYLVGTFSAALWMIVRMPLFKSYLLVFWYGGIKLAPVALALGLLIWWRLSKIGRTGWISALVTGSICALPVIAYLVFETRQDSSLLMYVGISAFPGMILSGTLASLVLWYLGNRRIESKLAEARPQSVFSGEPAPEKSAARTIFRKSKRKLAALAILIACLGGYFGIQGLLHARSSGQNNAETQNMTGQFPPASLPNNGGALGINFENEPRVWQGNRYFKVATVSAASPLYGRLHPGDWIYRVNGFDLHTGGDLSRIVHSGSPGTAISIEYLDSAAGDSIAKVTANLRSAQDIANVAPVSQTPATSDAGTPDAATPDVATPNTPQPEAATGSHGWNARGEAEQAEISSQCYEKNKNDACFEMARAILQDREITHDNLATAEDAYVKACEYGVLNACYNLGVEYASGTHFQRDLLNAASYYYRACKLGDQEACELRTKSLAQEDQEADDREKESAATSGDRQKKVYCEKLRHGEVPGSMNPGNIDYCAGY